MNTYDDMRKIQPILIDVFINNRKQSMELDTGAALSVMGIDRFRKLFEQHEQPEIKKVDFKLRTYTGELISPAGVADVQVKYRNEIYNLPLILTPGTCPPLLGRAWLKFIRINWKKVLNVLQIHENSDKEVHHLLQNVLNKYADVFQEDLEKFKDKLVTIPIKEGVIPKFCKARPVPYVIKQKIEDELHRLEALGVLTPTNHSDWASPIVPVSKPDGSIRICGDYKVFVNQAAVIDTYPVPKTEDLLAQINGGTKFTKIDLSQAYQQLEIDDPTKQLLTLNTHKGLFTPNRLQFGVHAASGIFQRELETLIGHVPFTIIRSDDVLISGKDDEECIVNISTVLQILSDNGIRANKKKCKFMVDEILFLGYLINKDGVSPDRTKIEPILKMPPTEDKTQLKSFLGMVNYYHRHLKNMSIILEPLHPYMNCYEKT